jgi:hypothetical protein
MNSTTEKVIGKVLEPVFRVMPPEIARQIVGLTADDESQDRVRYFAERANEGELTVEERNEYKALVDAGDILATLQALARQTLQHATEND